jgi:hypothetical protein
MEVYKMKIEINGILLKGFNADLYDELVITGDDGYNISLNDILHKLIKVDHCVSIVITDAGAAPPEKISYLYEHNK